jgi:hypothetical protein
MTLETDEQIFNRYVDQAVLRAWVEAKAGMSPYGTLPSNLAERQALYYETVSATRPILKRDFDVAAFRRTHEHYSKAQTEAALSALVELGHALEPYHDDIVLIGGISTYLLTKGFFDHCGSNDIDLVVKPSSMPYRGDTTIREILTSLNYDVLTARINARSYSSPENPNSFLKTDDKGYSISLNFLCEETDGADQVPIQDGLNAAPIHNIRGVEGIFNSEREIVAAQNRTSSRVVNLPGLLALKGAAGRPKDCYDIFALTHCNGGPQQAARLFTRSFRESTRSFRVPERYAKLLHVATEVIFREFKTGSSTGAHFVEAFDTKQKSDVVAKQVTQFIKRLNGYSFEFCSPVP